MSVWLWYTDQSDFRIALDYYERSLKINEQIGDQRNMALVLSNIGAVYYQLADRFSEDGGPLVACRFVLEIMQSSTMFQQY